MSFYEKDEFEAKYLLGATSTLWSKMATYGFEIPATDVGERKGSTSITYTSSSV